MRTTYSPLLVLFRKSEQDFAAMFVSVQPEPSGQNLTN